MPNELGSGQYFIRTNGYKGTDVYLYQKVPGSTKLGEPEVYPQSRHKLQVDNNGVLQIDFLKGKDGKGVVAELDIETLPKADYGNATAIDKGGDNNKVTAMTEFAGFASATAGTGRGDQVFASGASEIDETDERAKDLGGDGSVVRTPGYQMTVEGDDAQISLGKEEPPPTVASE